MYPLNLTILLLWPALSIQADPISFEAKIFLDFRTNVPNLKLFHGAKYIEGYFGRALEFTTALQYAELACPHLLDQVSAVTIGGWFFPRRSGEQYFLFRGVPDIAPQGERFFRPQEQWVNYVFSPRHWSRGSYLWYAGDHDYPPEARQAAVAWFRRWFKQ